MFRDFVIVLFTWRFFAAAPTATGFVAATTKAASVHSTVSIRRTRVLSPLRLHQLSGREEDALACGKPKKLRGACMTSALRGVARVWKRSRCGDMDRYDASGAQSKYQVPFCSAVSPLLRGKEQRQDGELEGLWLAQQHSDFPVHDENNIVAARLKDTGSWDAGMDDATADMTDVRERLSGDSEEVALVELQHENLYSQFGGRQISQQLHDMAVLQRGGMMAISRDDPLQLGDVSSHESATPVTVLLPTGWLAKLATTVLGAAFIILTVYSRTSATSFQDDDEGTVDQFGNCKLEVILHQEDGDLSGPASAKAGGSALQALAMALASSQNSQDLDSGDGIRRCDVSGLKCLLRSAGGGQHTTELRLSAADDDGMRNVALMLAPLLGAAPLRRAVQQHAFNHHSHFATSKPGKIASQAVNDGNATMAQAACKHVPAISALPAVQVDQATQTDPAPYEDITRRQQFCSSAIAHIRTTWMIMDDIFKRLDQWSLQQGTRLTADQLDEVYQSAHKICSQLHEAFSSRGDLQNAEPWLQAEIQQTRKKFFALFGLLSIHWHRANVRVWNICGVFEKLDRLDSKLPQLYHQARRLYKQETVTDDDLLLCNVDLHPMQNFKPVHLPVHIRRGPT
eukprot:TRINITY_DN1525_c0_g2_i4.p1 TRINITY_DN1525_c0_g2~~TRINITY_DN1525_c0_g2_i4.p1  ORF type:complete len:647 (-),score=103.36 TRINITY_DN1525_c0_g2_i4:587-2467(-)